MVIFSNPGFLIIICSLTQRNVSNMVLWGTTVHRYREQEKGQSTRGQARVVGNQDQERQETKPTAKDAGSLSETGSAPTQQRETQHGRL